MTTDDPRRDEIYAKPAMVPIPAPPQAFSRATLDKAIAEGELQTLVLQTVFTDEQIAQILEMCK